MQSYWKDLLGDEALAGKYKEFVRDRYLSPLLRSRPSWSVTAEQKDQLSFVGATLHISASNNFSKKKHTDFIDEITHSINIIDGECGLGKTSMLIQFLKGLDKVCKGVVFVQQTDTAKMISESVGSKSSAIISDGSDGTIMDRLKKSLADGEHQIYVLTHAFLKQALKNREADIIWDTFDSITIDETFESYNTFSFSYQNINSNIKPILEQYETFPEVAEALEFINNIMKSMKSLVKKENEIFTRAKYSEFDNTIFLRALDVIKNPENKPLLGSKPKHDNSGMELLTALADRQENEIDYFHFVGNDPTWAFTYQYFPKKASLTFLFDGGVTEPSFQALQQYSKDINVNFVKLRYKDYSHWKFIIEEDSVGKTANTLTGLQSIEAVKKLNELTEDKLLVIGHKDTINGFENFNENIRAIHWGIHRSTNEFEDYNNIAILSWFIQPPHSYSSKFISYAGEQYQEGDYEKSDVMAKSVALELLQGIKRINRNSSTDDVTVYFRVPKSEQMAKAKEFVLDYIKKEFPSATFEYADWYSIKNNNLAQAKEWAEKIITAFHSMIATTGKSVFRASDLIEQTGINWKTFTGQNSKRLEMLNKLLNISGVVYSHDITVQDRKHIYIPSSNTRIRGWVFKGAFSDES